MAITEEDLNRRIKITLTESERTFFSEICERKGLRPARLARQIIQEYMVKQGFNADVDLKENTDEVKIYFKLGSEYGSLFDCLCWQEQKSRLSMARQIVVDRIKAFKKDEREKKLRSKKKIES